MSGKLQIERKKAKPITQYPGIMIVFGYIIGWVAHELYVAYLLGL